MSTIDTPAGHFLVAGVAFPDDVANRHVITTGTDYPYRRFDMPSGDAYTYYEHATWPVGTIVHHLSTPERRGTLVRRCARLWVDRDRRPPLVRWHGTTDAVPVAWFELRRPIERETDAILDRTWPPVR